MVPVGRIPQTHPKRDRAVQRCEMPQDVEDGTAFPLGNIRVQEGQWLERVTWR